MAALQALLNPERQLLPQPSRAPGHSAPSLGLRQLHAVSALGGDRVADTIAQRADAVGRLRGSGRDGAELCDPRAAMPPVNDAAEHVVRGRQRQGRSPGVTGVELRLRGAACGTDCSDSSDSDDDKPVADASLDGGHQRRPKRARIVQSVPNGMCALVVVIPGPPFCLQGPFCAGLALSHLWAAVQAAVQRVQASSV